VVNGLDDVDAKACADCDIEKLKIDSETGTSETTSAYINRFKNKKFEKAFRKTFKEDFKQKFIDTKRYEKSGLDAFQWHEKGKLADIFWEFQNQEANNKPIR